MYSIRSLCKHLHFDFEVVIVGDKPDWFTGKHIPTTPIRGSQYTRAFDIARKLEAICESDLVSEDFIYCYDDQYALDRIGLGYFGKVVASEKYTGDIIKGGSGNWNRLLEVTMKMLGAPNRPLWNYETHLPRMFNKTKLMQLHRDYDLHKNPMLFSSIYFNEYHDAPEIVLVEHNEVKAGVYSKTTYDQIKALCHGKLWLNNGENGWNPSLERFLKNNYPNPCRFENIV